MPAQRPRASFEPIPPDFDLKALVESTANFSYVDRISCDMIDAQGLPAFEKLIVLHVIVGGKPLVIDGFEDRLDPWSFTPKWLRDNSGERHENARNLTSCENLPLTMGHYLNNMGMLTNQFFMPGKPDAYRESKRQRVYLKDIDCPPVWQDKLREHIPSMLYYLNESTGELGGPGAVPDPNSNIPGRRLGKGIARAGDLMSSLPADMRAENLMCYIGHEGTYTPSHREMCASLGHNIMVEASSTVSPDDGKAEKPGSSIWFMTESKDRHTVSEYWLSVLGHDIEVENHFAQVVAWKKAPFNVYVVEQRPGDFILIPPLAPHQVWNRGTRTMKVAWNRTTVETLEMALNEALPRSRIVCRDEQYKNKAIIYYTLQKYSSLLTLAQTQASRLPNHEAAHALLTSPKLKQLAKDFKRLFNLYKQILLSEMFNPDEPPPKNIEYLPFDSNVTCAYCRGNIFNRFLTCPSCKDVLGHNTGDSDSEGDPYDVCMDCYAMGRSCVCISGLKWVEQFRWKELAAKYESWRKLIVALDGGQATDKTPLPILEEKKKLGRKTLAEVCKEQLKRRPWKDVHKTAADKNDEEDDEEEEEIVVDDNGTVKKIQKKKSKAWLKNNSTCHICCHRHPNWKMAFCSSCERGWCYGTLFRGWDKMPITIMEDGQWKCPHCLGICFAGACKREGKGIPYEPKGTLLGHDTRKVADARSVEALVDFSVSNLNWLKDDDPANRVESRRLKRANLEAERAKAVEPIDAEEVEEGVEESRVQFEDAEDDTPILDPALGGGRFQDEGALAWRLRQVVGSSQQAAEVQQTMPGAPEGYAAVSQAGYVPPQANMYPQPDEVAGVSSYAYPGHVSFEPVNRDGSEESGAQLVGGLRPFRKRSRNDNDEDDGGPEEGINMTRHPKAKKPRMSAAGFRSSDLADGVALGGASKAKNEAQRQFEREKERKALEKAKSEGRFIMLQAALRGKRRIVKLPIPGARLAQVLAQQAAKTAGDDDADAEHEVEEPSQQLQLELREETAGEGEDGEVVLRSDIAPKEKQNPKEYYAQRQKNGFVVNSTTKKALVPVERDGNYGYYPSKPKGGQKSSGGGDVEGRRKARKHAKNIEYEEVDIGSDEDVDGDSGLFVGASGTGTSATHGASGRRSLPNYLQSRYRGEDLPDELPVDFGRSQKNASRPGPTQRAKDGTSASAKTRTPQSAPSKGTTAKPTAGKRPSMRPSSMSGGNVTRDATEDGDATQDVIDAAANGEYMDVDDVMAGVQSFSAVNRPANGTGSTSNSQPSSRKNLTKGTSKAQAQKQKAMDEQNRLAKLQALEMVTAETGTPIATKRGRGRQSAGNGTVSMADAFQQDSSDEDSVEEVSARRSVRA